MAVPPFLQRLSLITGEEALNRLASAHVHVFGLGGVGSWTAEALVRSGLGAITIVDSDTVCITNINRQIEATTKTIGRLKTDALKVRLLEINPACSVTAIARVFRREDADSFGLDETSAVVDAIDSLTHKIALIEESVRRGKPLFSCMGMAQKLDPTQISTASIWKTYGCPLARLVRQHLKKNRFAGDFTAVFSPERLPLRTEIDAACGGPQCFCPSRHSAACSADCNATSATVEWCSSKKVINGSAVPVTATAGMVLASLALNHIINKPVNWSPIN